jgi:VWFA-related protein
MTRFCVAAAAFLLVLTVRHADLAGQTTATAPDRQSFMSGATAILVDVVVRDKKGAPVTDLSAADFEVFEDGVPQQLDSFTRVSRGGGIGVGVAWKSPEKSVAISTTSRPDAPVASEAEPEEATTALVFNHLSAEMLRLAQRATLDYVPMNGESPVRIGVFSTDPGVRIVQRYTTDLARVRRAVERVMPSGMSAQELQAERTDELMNRRRELAGTIESAAAGAVAGSGAVIARNAAELGQRENELRLVQTELNMMRSFDNLDRDHRGYDTALGLLTVVQSLAQYPGRKTIVFFSEGLPVSPALSARLDHVIDLANRANVTTYAIDAHGLRAKSTLTNMRKEMETFVEERFTQIGSGGDRTDQPLTMAFERVEDTMKLDSRTGLARLAADTGGFLIENSNDLSAAFRRIDEDNRFHYLLTYSPRNSEFDGKFRSIRVKVRRSGTAVFSRRGYRAIRAPGGLDAGSYDLPALALLDKTPLPNAFSIHASGFSFPDPARPGLTPIVVKVRTDALRFTIDQQRSTYSGQAAIVVRISDGNGDEMQKLSQQYVLSGDAKDLEAARNGEILFYREVDLPPGVYNMESIVFDAGARQGSARVATLTVPPVQRGKLGMSSLLLVNRFEEVSDAPAPGTAGSAPLFVGRTLLYPNLGEPIQKSATADLPFYFAVYGNVQTAKATAQLLRNGQPLAEAPVELSAAAGTRVQHVGRLPLGALPMGTYELRIRVTDGRDEQSRTAFFTLRD